MFIPVLKEHITVRLIVFTVLVCVTAVFAVGCTEQTAEADVTYESASEQTDAAPLITETAAPIEIFDTPAYTESNNRITGQPYVLEFTCDYSQYGGNTLSAVKSSVCLPNFIAKTAAANELNIQIKQDFMTRYDMYLPYLETGDTDKAPLQIIVNYDSIHNGDIYTVVVRTRCLDFITGQKTVLYNCYYYNIAAKEAATIEDYLKQCEIYTAEVQPDSYINFVAAQLNSEQVRLANSSAAREFDGYTITGDDITGVYRSNKYGGFRAVVEIGKGQFVFELPAGTDHSYTYYYIYDDTKSGDNLAAYLLVRDTDITEIECYGKAPGLQWLDNDKLAVTLRLSDYDSRVSLLDMSDGSVTNEFVLSADDICKKFDIDPEYQPKSFGFGMCSLSSDGGALICSYYLYQEMSNPYDVPVGEGTSTTYNMFYDNREGYLRADLATGEMSFIEIQPTVIPTEFKEITLYQTAIREYGFGQPSDSNNDTVIEGVSVTLTIPATWTADSSYLYSDSTRTAERGYTYNKRFEGCYFLYRVGADFVWDGDIEARLTEQYGNNNDYYNGESGIVFTNKNGYTAVEYDCGILHMWYIRVADDLAIYISMYTYEEDPAGYAGILHDVADSVKVNF